MEPQVLEQEASHQPEESQMSPGFLDQDFAAIDLPGLPYFLPVESRFFLTQIFCTCITSSTTRSSFILSSAIDLSTTLVGWGQSLYKRGVPSLLLLLLSTYKQVVGIS